MPLLTRPIDYSKLRQELARAVARVCPRWQPARRDDLVQAAVMRVMQILDRQPGDEEEAAFSASYLHKVAFTTLIDELRRQRRRGETALEDDVAETMAVEQHDPEQLAAARDIGHGIQDCLRQMSRDRRLAVTLHLQGHSVPESARLLDWNAKRTENLVYRGLSDLRACLASKGIRP